ncbi:MAG: DNA-3-methyladenine glycosylase family protein [Gaiellales bacterium]
MPDLVIEPAAPYDLLRSARGGDRITRRVVGDRVELALRGGVVARVRQRPDRALLVEIEGHGGAEVERDLRFRLDCDAPIGAFIDRVREDALLGPLVRRAPGLRALRTGTVAHAALQAFAGQLITFREAQAIERRIVRLAVPGPRGGLVPSPTAQQILDLGTARLVACGLAQRRADALMRLLRGIDLERLRTLEATRVASRLARESQVGPWSIGVIGLHGYGWRDHGLVGDLGLMRLAAAVHGRAATAEDTAELLAPYAPWRGLASVHLLAHPLARQPRR